MVRSWLPPTKARTQQPSPRLRLMRRTRRDEKPRAKAWRSGAGNSGSEIERAINEVRGPRHAPSSILPRLSLEAVGRAANARGCYLRWPSHPRSRRSRLPVIESSEVWQPGRHCRRTTQWQSLTRTRCLWPGRARCVVLAPLFNSSGKAACSKRPAMLIYRGKL